MAIEDLGNIAELIAALGVVVSLIYLAKQLKSNTIALRADSRDKNFTNFIAVNQPALIDKELTRVWLDGLENTQSLDREDSERFQRMLVERMVYIQLLYVRGVESGDKQAPIIAQNLLEPIIASPGGRDGIKSFRGRQEFMIFVNSLISEQ